MDYGVVEESIHRFLREKLEALNASGYVVGVSGGLDSATTLTLVVDAVGAEKVSAWIMPGVPSSRENRDDARWLCERLGVEIHEVDIEPVVKAVTDAVDFETGKEVVGNVRARVRMILEYMDANQNGRLVLGTGNRSEYLLGYFTKHGDGAADLRPLQELYKTEVRELARHIDVPDRFIEKDPSAELWEGQSDADEIGAGYAVIDAVLRMVVDEGLAVEEVAEREDVAIETVEKIRELYERSRHKREPAGFVEIER